MQTGQRKSPLAPLRRALARREGGGLSDAELLGRFLARQDEAAFEVLVRRHGAMVLGVCRRVLGHAQDAEDAFQATFLILVRRGAAIRKRESVGNWLYGVAYRTSLEARAAAARRHVTERQVSAMPEPAVGPTEPADDLRAVLDAELARLPEKYRAALVLCDLQGHARREAARQLAVPEGTLSSRLAAGRRLLADRLARRGISFSLAALVTSLSAATAGAAVPAPLVQATLGAATTLAAGEAGAAAVSANVLLLTQKVVRAMLMTKAKLAIPFLLAVTILGAGAGSVWTGATGREPDPGPRLGGFEAAQGVPQLRAAGQAPRNDLDEMGVWALDLKCKDLRVLTVHVPERAKKTVWYLLYEVVNRTGKPRLLIPDFELVTLDKQPTYHDEVIPQALEAIRRVEDPAGRLQIKNAVTVAAEPIPPTKPGATARPVVGVAIWENLPSDASRFSVFVSGLSNGFVVDPLISGKSEPPLVRRKTLRLNFKRVGDRMVFVPPAEWVYRAAKVVVPGGRAAQRQPDKAGPDADPARAVPWVLDWCASEMDLAGPDADIARGRLVLANLEKQAEHWQKERHQLQAMIREWRKLIGQAPAEEGARERDERQAVLKGLERRLASGDRDDLARQADLQLLRRRLKALPQAPGHELKREEPPPEGRGELRGKVQKVEGDLLLLSVGADDGARPGERLEVFRLGPQPVYLGQVEILEVQPRASVARLLRRSPGQTPRAGDEVGRAVLDRH
jgi:RNA polymerase sigma factor (sigma-70 family)